jgi:AraC family transcriptional regulator
MTEAYGQRLGEASRVENVPVPWSAGGHRRAPAIVTRALRTADMAVTEVRCDNPLPEMKGPLPPEDAFLVTLHLRDAPNHECWEGGRRVSGCDLWRELSL